ncbi:hypothetical protein B0H16DRAFT_1715656 [Mycena metata]|uniref:tRNA ligase kinase domain-containing protein n=1 Tax=Mycena metata TaxID=1033252 RepID=A0AAD7JRI5_9AGAR|nr:hypothetical protein B0H16DRAFT_1715656 [Mycena metata]
MPTYTRQTHRHRGPVLKGVSRIYQCGLSGRAGAVARAVARRAPKQIRMGRRTDRKTKKPQSLSKGGWAGEEGGERRCELQGGKTIIVLVVIPGCGKTAVAVALTHIFGFGHTQSDDVRAKKPAPVFVQNLLDLLKKHDVVVADKCEQAPDAAPRGTARRHRLVLAVRQAPRVNWGVDTLRAALVHCICADRVQQRGTNQQALLASSDDAAKKLRMFLQRAQPLAADEVDAVVLRSPIRLPRLLFPSRGTRWLWSLERKELGGDADGGADARVEEQVGELCRVLFSSSHSGRWRHEGRLKENRPARKEKGVGAVVRIFASTSTYDLWTPRSRSTHARPHPPPRPATAILILRE